MEDLSDSDEASGGRRWRNSGVDLHGDRVRQRVVDVASGRRGGASRRGAAGSSCKSQLQNFSGRLVCKSQDNKFRLIKLTY